MNDIENSDTMNGKRVFIHPGYARAGTTTLHENLFKNHPEIISIGEPFTDLGFQLYDELRKVEYFDYDEVTVQALINKMLVCSDRNNARCVVLSDDSLLWGGMPMSGPGRFLLVPMMAKRLKRFFPNAHIIFTIRNQIKLLESSYANSGHILKHVPLPHTGKNIRIDNWISFLYEHKNSSYLRDLDYNSIISVYEKIFGKNCIHIFLLEQLASDSNAYINKLVDTLSINKEKAFQLLSNKRNKQRPSNRKVSYYRFRQKFFPGLGLSKIMPFGSFFRNSFNDFIVKGKPLKDDIPENWVHLLADLYSKGNTDLSSRYGLNLEEYQYPITEQPK